MNYRDKDAGGIPLPHRTHRHCHSLMQAPVNMLNHTSATCGEFKTDGTQSLQNQASRPSDSYLKLSHHPINGPMPECETCSGEHPDRVLSAKN